MAFHEIEKSAFGIERKSNTVSAWTSANGSAHILMSGDIYARIGSPAYVKVLIGAGQHAGFIAIVPRNMPGNTSYKIGANSPTGHQRKITISCAKIGVAKGKRSSVDLSHEITDDGLVVDVRLLRQPILAAAE